MARPLIDTASRPCLRSRQTSRSCLSNASVCNRINSLHFIKALFGECRGGARQAVMGTRPTRGGRQHEIWRALIDWRRHVTLQQDPAHGSWSMQSVSVEQATCSQVPFFRRLVTLYLSALRPVAGSTSPQSRSVPLDGLAWLSSFVWSSIQPWLTAQCGTSYRSGWLLCLCTGVGSIQ